MLAKKILVVDDDPAIIEAFEMLLGEAGYSISIARSGEEALAKVKADKPDLILLDVMMPEGSGYEVMVQIRNVLGIRDTPAIVLSGKKGWDMFFEGISNIEFHLKPVDARVLIGRIEHHIGKCRRHPDQPKRVVLFGVDGHLDVKIKELLTRLDFQVLTALNEKEAIQLAKENLPDIILAQFWEDAAIHDVERVANELLHNPTVEGTPFYVFCEKALFEDALKRFTKDQLIPYAEASDLLRQMEALILKLKF